MGNRLETPSPSEDNSVFHFADLIMFNFMLALHITSVCLVVGTLFVQSLSVIFRLRLTDPVQVEGVQWIQWRIYLFIYHPILVVTIGSGFYLASTWGHFQSGWLHAKLGLLLVLILFGFLNGRQIRNKDLPKPLAMFVHIGIFCTSVLMIWLVQTKPF